MTIDKEARPTQPGIAQGDTQPINPALKSSMIELQNDQAALAQAQAGLRRSVRILGGMTVLVTALALLSLAANFLLITKLLQIRSGMAATLENASHSLDNLSGQTVAFDVPISQTVNFEGDVPIKQDLKFPFKADVPVNTTVSVPINLGPLGTESINIPVNTTIPVDITVPVHVEQTVHVQTQLPVRVTFPVRLSTNDPPLKDWIAQARAWLDMVRRSL